MKIFYVTKNSKRKYLGFMHGAACLLFSAVILNGCTTVEQPLPVVDYSDERSFEYTVSAIQKKAETNISYAVIQALRLKHERQNDESERLYQSLIEMMQSSAVSAYTDGRYFDSLRDISSLMSLGEQLPNVDGSTLTMQQIENTIRDMRIKNNDTILLPPAAGQTITSHAKVSDYIQGTVTVWVNQGMKLQKGISSPAIVIGSGFFIDKRGYLITNYHVIESEVNPEYEGFSRLYIKMSDDPETRIPAKVVGWDPVLDLALVKTTVDVPYVFPLGSSADLDTGDTIFAIGSPAGLERTLTSGIVSADDRRLLSMGSIMQIDAPINHGNSGGPIISRDGAVQAVVFAGAQNAEGLNFAIPVEYVKSLLPKLYEGGKIEHPWMGAYGKDVKNIVTNDGTSLSGVQLHYVLPSSSSDIAGIPIGSVITSVNGKTIHTVQELQAELINCRPNQIIPVTANNREYLVPLSGRPALPGKSVIENDVKNNVFVPLMGMKLSYLGGRLRPKYSIQKIYPGSIADESGFSEQDPFTLLDMKVDQKAGAVFVRIDVQKRKNGFLESDIGFGLPLDSPDYF